VNICVTPLYVVTRERMFSSAKILGCDFESTNIWQSYWPGLCCNGKITIRVRAKKTRKREGIEGSESKREGESDIIVSNRKKLEGGERWIVREGIAD
jgi:hypothetical protein